MPRDLDRNITLLLSLFFFSSVQADGLPTPFSAYYKGSGLKGLGSAACVTLSHKQGSLVYEYKSKVFGRRFYQSSVLRAEDDRFYPIEFQHRAKGRNIHTVFDRQNSIIKTTRSGKKPNVATFPRDEEIWDLLSFQLKLMTDLRKHDKPATFTYHVVNKSGRIKTYRMGVVSFEKVKTKEGHYDAWKVERVADKDAFYLWFAPGLDYMPVKIQKGAVRMKLYSRSCKDLS